MSLLNYAKNSFFDDNDYALHAVARERQAYNVVNPNVYPLSVDLIQAPDCYVMIADVPGVSKDRITVAVKDGKVFIEGKRKKKVVSSEDVYLLSERRNGPFNRIVTLPVDADADSMVCKIEDGLLVITIPRVKEVNGLKYVTINYFVCYRKKNHYE